MLKLWAPWTVYIVEISLEIKIGTEYLNKRSIQQQWTNKFLAAASGVTWFNENCHGGYEWDGVCLTVYMLYCLISAPFDLSLCNLIVFQSNMY